MRFRGIARVASMLAFAALTAALIPGATGASNGKPSFGADVVLPGGQGGEPSIAVDPHDASRLVSAWSNHSGKGSAKN